jgi:ATP-dependent DNA helicase RecG
VKSELEIKDNISLGEDSLRQFKVSLDKVSKLAEELCAFSNSGGGTIYIGVNDTNEIIGLNDEQVRTYNQWLGSASNDLVKPPIYPQTQIVKVDGKLLMLVNVPSGSAKPYSTSEGIYFIKSGSDKRKASPQELLRLFQTSEQIYLDETPTSAEIVARNNNKEEWGVDLAKFYSFFEKNYGQQISETGITTEQVLVNMNLAKGSKLTLGGLLLFGANVQGLKPYCIIRAVCYAGNEISDDLFIDKRDCIGTLEEQYRGAMIFLKNNLHNLQTGVSFNTNGVLEIDLRALEEAVVNALLHRDYGKNAVIRLFVFKNRVEIISPGSLPNHLTIDNIKSGNSVIRNPILASFGTKILPYSGIGSGIPRILKNHPQTEFVNDKSGEQFVATLFRNSSENPKSNN